ncbi:S24 family peptidase [Enterobacter sp.]|uniref:HumD family translesion DNA polymerase n=1 Tax=Enterobacter sp. TaxID=42895 RepID=UPI00296FEC48|nr:S24 family peptidase [Enterobacter sp.]
MGFPSPAADYEEQRISLDQLCITRPSATYFVRVRDSCVREGILPGALLVIDSAAEVFDGSIVVCAIAGEFSLARYRKHPAPHIESLQDGRPGEIESEDDAVFGVVTYIVNDARDGEFDDCPVM